MNATQEKVVQELIDSFQDAAKEHKDKPNYVAMIFGLMVLALCAYGFIQIAIPAGLVVMAMAGVSPKQKTKVVYVPVQTRKPWQDSRKPSPFVSMVKTGRKV